MSIFINGVILGLVIGLIIGTALGMAFISWGWRQMMKDGRIFVKQNGKWLPRDPRNED
jgi:MFS family permease